MNRRNVLFTGLAGTVIGVGTTTSAAAAVSKIAVEAPDDVTVISIAPNGRVAKGQQIVELRSFNIEKFELHLSLLDQHIEILERPFLDGRVDAEIAQLKVKAQFADDIRRMGQLRVDQVNTELSLGMPPLGSPVDSKGEPYTTRNPPLRNLIVSGNGTVLGIKPGFRIQITATPWIFRSTSTNPAGIRQVLCSPSIKQIARKSTV
jgi:hypothetical protein